MAFAVAALKVARRQARSGSSELRGSRRGVAVPQRAAVVRLAAQATASGGVAAGKVPKSAGRWFDAPTSACGTCEVYVPAVTSTGTPPRGVVHFIGGAALSTAPRAVYGALLERVANASNVVVVATPVPVRLGHAELARSAAEAFEDVRFNHLPLLLPNVNIFSMPSIGMGHSLGAKLLVILASDPLLRAAAGVRLSNVLLSYNNFSAETSIPLYSELRQLSGSSSVGAMLQTASEFARTLRGFGPLRDMVMQRAAVGGVAEAATSAQSVADFAASLDSILRQLDALQELQRNAADANRSVEFSPTPRELEMLVDNHYNITNNLIVRFRGDRIDQSEHLATAISRRFLAPESSARRPDVNPVVFRELSGSHLTPATPRVDVAGALQSVEQMLPVGVAAMVQQGLSAAATSASDQLEQLVVVIAAFIRLQLELYESKTQKILTSGDWSLNTGF
mmetsp:Transcript_5937/g.15766  ORF Transcript_5937/g.15766 Transcript_5937/m.15766 type:complete len:452 (-) Transcript_5937:1257-2612(-)|eukprot:CAMPEP_0185837684 /NCGR_PEP_ID=MMETSP1353-20130828/11832_1 /TAXON_ID=1077150 /ORGANISM="Erythrolobus australicus, Strain CCMP3124" /LENGTH=451 /DNA_ID=CAMNT_0028536631 /DNA_START=42 /DNA_END=1397 /DNA_ORIENTATION=+